jgi:hypothetical protein
MKNLAKIGSGIDIRRLHLELKRHPELWNVNTGRTSPPDSPHRDADDIWVRYAEDPQDSGPHVSVWYPAWNLLPSLREIVFGVMSLVQAEALGGVLITRIPPGKRVHEHTDLGWHAQYYDKIAVQIESHQQQAFYFDEGGFSAAPGDIYWFNNHESHWVENNSPVDRISLIICVRLETPPIK